MDDITVIRGCYGDQFDHAPAIYLRSTGFQLPGRPCLGILGDLRPGHGESESAGLRGYVRRLDEVRAARLIAPAFCRPSIRAPYFAAEKARFSI